MKIYVATSWRNNHCTSVVEILRGAGHKVFDFRFPGGFTQRQHLWSSQEMQPGGGFKSGSFHWSELDPKWERWSREQYCLALEQSKPKEAFRRDMSALDAADAVVMVTPCGASAHLELGYAEGRAKRTAIFLAENQRPELMYCMVEAIVLNATELIAWASDG